MSKTKWSRNQKLIALGIVTTIFVAFAPGVWRRLNLEKPTPMVPPRSAPVATTPQIPSPENSEAPKKALTSQRTKVTVKGDRNTAGNNVAGNRNIVGNDNQTGAIANAPNGIAITGGSVTNPTVNNFGPSPLQLVWSVGEMPENRPNIFEKTVTIKSNTYYSPVNIVILCDSEIENASPFGVSIGASAYPITEDKKSWFLRVLNPPVTPDSPMTVLVQSKKPFKVLDVRKVETKQP